mmetsp:Transcript_25098/g.51554  ORF Transcript_25098/g.51554 Transcript_25098/m.51554 type:complete len:399 (-) Transcript_25098:708-1904(-)
MAAPDAVPVQVGSQVHPVPRLHAGARAEVTTRQRCRERWNHLVHESNRGVPHGPNVRLPVRAAVLNQHVRIGAQRHLHVARHARHAVHHGRPPLHHPLLHVRGERSPQLPVLFRERSLKRQRVPSDEVRGLELGVDLLQQRLHPRFGHHVALHQLGAQHPPEQALPPRRFRQVRGRLWVLPRQSPPEVKGPKRALVFSFKHAHVYRRVQKLVQNVFGALDPVPCQVQLPRRLRHPVVHHQVPVHDRLPPVGGAQHHLLPHSAQVARLGEHGELDGELGHAQDPEAMVVHGALEREEHVGEPALAVLQTRAQVVARGLGGELVGAVEKAVVVHPHFKPNVEGLKLVPHSSVLVSTRHAAPPRFLASPVQGPLRDGLQRALGQREEELVHKHARASRGGV